MTTAHIYLIPVPLAENALHTIPQYVQEIATNIQHYFVENIRTARRFLKSMDKNVDIDAIQFSEVNVKAQADIILLKKWIKEGHTIGIMSEAGCPAVADPGSALVSVAQELQAKVTPLIGPSSILLSLMASGFSGQRFRFIEYLPIKEPHRSKAIKELEDKVHQLGETQIFIETPYRNNQLMQELIKHCHVNTRLCIASNINSDNEKIQTKPIKFWKENLPDLHKQPVIFLLGQ